MDFERQEPIRVHGLEYGNTGTYGSQVRCSSNTHASILILRSAPTGDGATEFQSSLGGAPDLDLEQTCGAEHPAHEILPAVNRPPPIRFRGRPVGQPQVLWIRRLLRRRPNSCRSDLARRIARHFGWRRPNGELAERSCLDLLHRLNRARQIPVLPGRRAPRPGRPIASSDALARPPWPEIWVGHRSWSTDSLVVRPIEATERRAWRQHIARYHYLGDRPLVGESLRYVALLDGEVVALVGWAAASLRNPPRDEYIGWNWTLKMERLPLVANNIRFLVLPWAKTPNLASRVLAANLRRLSRDWEAWYGHPVYLAETFVDRARFRGTCYLASNWSFVGQTVGWSRNGAGYRYHGYPKAVFLYPLRPHARELLNAPGRTPWTSAEEGPLIDVSRLPLAGEGGLIDVLGKIRDCRKKRGVRHRLVAVVAMGICATLSGARSFAAIAQWAAAQTQEFRAKLGSRRREPPSEPTIRRVLSGLDAEEVDRVTGAWLAEHALTSGEAACVAIDAKTLRGSRSGSKPPVQLISALLHREGIVVAQTAVPATTNETKCVEPLLSSVDLKGAVVTGDAAHVQTPTAEHLVKGKGADYVFTVKDNQPTLRQHIEDLDLGSFSPSGRYER